jgi:hypothetical protein
MLHGRINTLQLSMLPQGLADMLQLLKQTSIQHLLKQTHFLQLL